ncbi:MAG: hypothetical protein FWC47_03085 [Oscillospiraceae bacterium]|nr:hypothetical protein [Oscillospiraceae bacterium]
MINTDFEEEILRNLCEMAKENEPFLNILQYLISSFHLNKYSRIKAIRYFRIAFQIDLKYAKALGAWDFFDGGTWNIDEVEKLLKPLIEETVKEL